MTVTRQPSQGSAVDGSARVEVLTVLDAGRVSPVERVMMSLDGAATAISVRSLYSATLVPLA